MLFNSFIFILVFLPLTLSGYFFINRYSNKAAQILLFVMSLVFYGYNNPYYVFIIVGSILVNYILARYIAKEEKIRYRRVLLIVGLIFNIAIIGYFKYLSFIKWNVNYFLGTDFVINFVALPLGISFYTIQQISFLVDAYNDRKMTYSLREYALFVTFFPQLVAGPIVYHDELIPQYRDESKRTINYENLLVGITWFILGLAKKVFIADCLGNGVRWGHENIDALSTIDAWILSFAYTFQIYFDFSGYSDMACGIAKMFNFSLPQNFNSPYKSLSIADFWKRWHMSLTRFLTRYIYIPLGGNRKGNLKTIFNIMVVFTVSGIWHGANYTFILWGILNGVLSIINRYTGRFAERIPKFIKWSVNFLTINFLWLLFGAKGLKEFAVMIKKMLSLNIHKLAVSSEMLKSFNSYIRPDILMAMAFAICIFLPNNYVREKRMTYPAIVGAAALLVLCLLTLNRVSIFLYFNF